MQSRTKKYSRAVVLIASTIIFPQLSVSQTSNAIAAIERTQGFTALQREGSWQRVSPGDALIEGDKIYAGDRALVEFEFIDGTTTTLGEFSNFSIEVFDWTEAQTAPSALFTLYSGVFRTITGKVTLTNSPRFVVDTPLASIGIRGTDFWGGYLDAGKVDVFFVDGDHSIEISTNSGTALLETPGQGITLSEDGGMSEVVTWGAAKINRAVDTVTFD